MGWKDTTLGGWVGGGYKRFVDYRGYNIYEAVLCRGYRFYGGWEIMGYEFYGYRLYTGEWRLQDLTHVVYRFLGCTEGGRRD